MKNIIKEIAIIIILITVLIMGLILIIAPDKAARERFGDGTCQSCGDAKYEQVTIDRNGCKVYECPKCDDSVRFGGH